MTKERPVRTDAPRVLAPGGRSLSSSVVQQRLDVVLGRLADSYALSRRERQVLGLTMCGVHTKAIASQLGCSPKTVEEYWRRMYRKTGKRAKLEIVAEVLAESLASPALRSNDGGVRIHRRRSERREG